MDNNLEKAVKPEISKDTLLEVVKELQEIIIGIIEVEEEETESETEDTEIEITPTNPSPIGDPDKNDINWPVSKSTGEEDKEDYESDNEEEDKWDNISKACWSGYTQRGMKDKNGRMVPNCVPVEKSDTPEVTKSLWNDMFHPNRFDKKIF